MTAGSNHSIKFGQNETDVISFKTKNASIVGENGSGKSTLMREIKRLNSNATIISAQKNLTIKQGQFRGQDDAWLQNNRSHFEGPTNNGNIPSDNNNLQVDFNHVLEFIYREYTDESVQALNTGKKLDEIKRKLDQVFNVWNSIFIDRSLLYENKKIVVRSNKDSYDIETLSDGERCALYVLIKVILADNEDSIVIDEPETFLNPALLNQLFDECEKLKPNALFIYFSHDLEFVTTRKNNTIFWIKNYEYPKTWDIQPVDSVEIPDELIIKVIGAKKEKVLFVESEQNKDAQLYQLIYTDFKVWPVGSCSNVINYTKAFNSRTEKFNKEYYGLIDRDFKSQPEIQALEKQAIYSIPTAIYEGLFLRKEIVEFVLRHLGITDIDSKVELLEKDLKEKVVSTNFKNEYIKSKTQYEFDSQIEQVATTGKFEVDAKQYESEISALQSKSLEEILAGYNQKEIKSCTTKIGYSWSEWQNHVLNILSNTIQSQNLRSEFLKFMPTIS